jgi:O-acetyl-ADP-ribose deacetylase (regulator of RNase III)
MPSQFELEESSLLASARLAQVRVVAGDIFSSRAQTLVNPVNTKGVMGAGLALEFKRRYPQMFEDYRRRCTAGELRLGEPYLWKPAPEQLELGSADQPADERWIVNFPTKDHWRDPSRLQDILAGLDSLAAQIPAWGVRSLACPALGCGLGGLDWAAVGPLVQARLARCGIPAELFAPSN